MSVGVCIKLFYSLSSGNCFMTSVGHFDTCFQNVLVKKQRYLSLFLFFVISSFRGVGGGGEHAWIILLDLSHFFVFL